MIAASETRAVIIGYERCVAARTRPRAAWGRWQVAVNKKDAIYDRVVEDLIQAKYRFGDRILVKELAAATGFSRQPIMTALGRLESDGFVQIVPQVGCQVVNPGREAIADFYLMFGRMEGLLTELAAERRDERALRTLADIQSRITMFDKEGQDAAQEYRVLNRAFHQTIHTMARSPLLDERQRSLFSMSDFFINQSIGFQDLRTDVAREHDEILEAIARQSRPAARYAAEAHIAAVSSFVLAGMKAASPPAHDALTRAAAAHGTASL